MITIVAKFTLKNNFKEKFKFTASKLIEKSRMEKGNISYDLYEDLKDENIVTFIEVWKDDAAIEVHNSTEHFTSIVPLLEELQSCDAQVNIYRKVK